MKNYKIFVDAHIFDGEFQGTVTYVKELYLKVLFLDPNITLYFGANKLENIKEYFVNQPNVKYIQYSSRGSFERIFIEIPQIINRLGCTHAHFQYVIPFIKNKNCKYIVTIHDILFNDFSNDFSFLYRLQRNILFFLSAKRSDYLLTVSDYSKQKIAKQFNIKANEIIITPNAVSDDYFQFKTAKEVSKKYISDRYAVQKFILYVSRIEPRKNQNLLVKAFAKEKLYEKGFSLVLIGDNTLHSGLFDDINDLKKEVKKSIYWFRKVTDLDLKNFLNAAEFFVYPSKAEGFGIPPLEAGALSTPVACSNTTAMADFDFFNPYFFDPNNYEEFVRIINQMAQNVKNIDLSAIQSTIKGKYSWEESARIMLEKVILA
ncbi:glycosyltransferase involved in cell wall biosynthesis [Flavobacterium sp. CG_9.1]|uniref:Glycosyltransferase involved in cell wall bisynthesis n=1 Tax=Flavobacterium xanthum TaxID=69322 RepID=A0A1M7GSZ9_9FLAO|nr:MULTISPECIES: glycosyltransferase family 1 protein [Flavobacterium]MBG6062024.1 glycosyltransferase involved in cell wall biosynthesis [Flavobacterium sp. CG_9.1]SHM19442.1 Glycosyltransferase involved in cell wall bisynthesis [Flavobacterium xanthum]